MDEGPLKKFFVGVEARIGSAGLGLSNEEFERFAALITAHTYSDRMLTSLMTLRLSQARNLQTAEATDALLDRIANLGFSAKMDLAESLSPSVEPPACPYRAGSLPLSVQVSDHKLLLGLVPPGGTSVGHNLLRRVSVALDGCVQADRRHRVSPAAR